MLALDLSDEGSRRPELDVGGGSVAVDRAEDVGQALADPALDPPGRHDDQLRRERIGLRRPQHIGQGVDQQVGPRRAVQPERAFGTVQAQRHRLPVPSLGSLVRQPRPRLGQRGSCEFFEPYFLAIFGVSVLVTAVDGNPDFDAVTLTETLLPCCAFVST